MDYLFKIVTLLYLFAVCNAKTYKAAVVNTPADVTVDSYASLIHNASKSNADILVLPPAEFSCSENLHTICNVDKYDEILKSVSNAARNANLYVVAHLYEKIRCQNKNELIKNNLVFDRQGSVISVYRKPFRGSECNITNTNMATFTSDFGVTFGILMEEDLVLKKLEDLKGINNFVVTGKASTNIPLMSANQFSSAWSYATNANLITNKGIFAGRAGLKTGSDEIIAVELNENGGEDISTINVGVSKLTSFPGEDLSQYTIRPMDIEASIHGYHQTVCHDKFCCDFHLKTSLIGNPKEINYGLVVFNGVQHYDRHHSIGVQSCAVIACVGLYKRNCFISSENTTNVVFEEIIISGNFTKNSAQFPIILTTDAINTNNLNIEQNINNDKHVTVKLHNTQDVMRFGIFSRDYSKDYDSLEFENVNKTDVFSEVAEYISSENVQEFFDYVWIRLRVIIFVVSIYVLEMM